MRRECHLCNISTYILEYNTIFCYQRMSVSPWHQHLLSEQCRRCPICCVYIERMPVYDAQHIASVEKLETFVQRFFVFLIVRIQRSICQILTAVKALSSPAGFRLTRQELVSLWKASKSKCLINGLLSCKEFCICHQQDNCLPKHFIKHANVLTISNLSCLLSCYHPPIFGS